tara:strand:- start:418 stop:612 length:195 start_codon:yes stop_codon:yes gene_type:complete
MKELKCPLCKGKFEMDDTKYIIFETEGSCILCPLCEGEILMCKKKLMSFDKWVEKEFPLFKEER